MQIKQILEKMKSMKMDSSLNNEIIYDCEICRDNEYILQFKDDYEVAIECKCLITKNIQRRIKTSQITVDFRKMNFMNFDTSNLDQKVRNAHKCALNYMSSYKNLHTKQNSIALLGQSGAGKTHLLTAICNVLLDNQERLIYFPFVEGFNEIKNNFDILDERINKLQYIDYLFIDDLFKGRKPTEFQIEQMFAIINYRYLNNKPILISSEKTINDLIQIDEALGSRIYEMCKNFIVELKGNLNYRLRSVDND